ncbi:MAG: hypothetical protein RLZZ407_404 [Pseudomonadota bacterium]
MSCWICGSSENLTGEHIFKRSDAKMLLGPVSQKKPVFFHTKNQINKRVGSFKNEVFKFSKTMCARCNNTVTQPYDKAWETASSWFFDNGNCIKEGDKFRWNRIFPYETRKNMIFVQLFFTKLMGCCLHELGYQFDRKEFSKSIIGGRINPSVYLKLNVSQRTGIGVSEPFLKPVNANNEVEEAIWSYQIGKVHIHVFFLHCRKINRSQDGWWHPNQNSNRIIVQSCI